MNNLAKRYQGNPILSPESVRPSKTEMVVECLLNPGVFFFENSIWMLVRVAERPVQEDGRISFPVMRSGEMEILSFEMDDPLLDTRDPREPRYDGEVFLSTLSHLRLFKSEDGIDFEDTGSLLMGKGLYESYGVEDCRVATLEDGSYALTYTATSEMGYGVGLRTTRNWKSFDCPGMILPPANKDCAIFEHKIRGRHYCFHRPSGVGLGGHFIWLAHSENLLDWGGHECLAKTRPGYWDCARVGAGAAPIRTEEGLLAIYHGANHENRYCLGALLLDSEDPRKVLARSEKPIMEPDAPYEKEGFFGNVVFSNGHLVEGDRIGLYYGASDTVICQAELSLASILESLK